MKYFSEASTQALNPNPKNYSRLTIKEFVGKVTICALEVNYPGCTPYAGNKILVYRATKTVIESRLELDPHFLENDTSPIARFPFTYEGWQDAQKYAQKKSREEKFIEVVKHEMPE